MSMEQKINKTRKMKMIKMLMALICVSSYVFGQDVYLDDYDVLYRKELETSHEVIQDHLYQAHDSMLYRTKEKYNVVAHNLGLGPDVSIMTWADKNLREAGKMPAHKLYQPYNLSLKNVVKNDEGEWLALFEFNPGLPEKVQLKLFNANYITSFDRSQYYNTLVRGEEDLILGIEFKKDQGGHYKTYELAIPLRADLSDGNLLKYHIYVNSTSSWVNQFNYRNGFYTIELTLMLNFNPEKTEVYSIKTKDCTDQYLTGEYELHRTSPIRYVPVPAKFWFSPDVRRRALFAFSDSHGIVEAIIEKAGLSQEWIEYCKECRSTNYVDMDDKWLLDKCHITRVGQ